VHFETGPGELLADPDLKLVVIHVSAYLAACSDAYIVDALRLLAFVADLRIHGTTHERPADRAVECSSHVTSRTLADGFVELEVAHQALAGMGGLFSSCANSW
jgi:hypothetical protein